MLLSSALILFLLYKKLLSKHNFLACDFEALNTRNKEILETLHFQQISVTNIGSTIQSVISEECQQQNSTLFFANEENDCRRVKTNNWRKVSELAERLAYFTLRNENRDVAETVISSKAVFAQNEMMLNSILSSKEQQLDLVQQDHSMLNMPTGMLDKILRGVVIHASKAANPNTILSVRCDTGMNSFNFSVTAWGEGISSQEVHNINLSVRTNPRFHFAKRAQDDEGDLNLASIHRLVTQFGGSVKLACALNYATVIYVSLPANKDAISLNHEKPSATNDTLKSTHHIELPKNANAVDTGKSKILIIDQNDTSQMIVHRALQSKYQCFACTAPLESMQLIHNLQPAIILIDQILPDIDPLELLKLIRENPQTEHTPIIVCCGIAAQSFRLSVLRLGASFIIEKPLRPTELQLTVAGLLEQQQRVAEKVGEKLSEYHSQQLAVPQASAFESDKDSRFIVRFNEMMDENFANEQFTREIAAQHMNMCFRTLNRRLNEYYSHNFKEHLKKYRLEKAKHLLTKGHSINEASLEVGFSSASYFSTCFKAEYGFAPSRLVAQCA
jgi:AraC-like DNA-binding protein/CheY-like chemotaxis protein